jgi:hypothetical protein
MSARPYRWHWFWFAALCAGCTSGLSEPIVVESAQPAAGSGGAAGLSGTGGNAGRAGRPASGGAAGGEPSYCPDGDPMPGTLDREQQLFRLLNSAIADGSFCEDRALILKDDLSCGARRYARALAADMRMSGSGAFPPLPLREGWTPTDPSGDGWLWGKRHLMSAQDAKNDLIEEKEDFCDSPLHMTYKSVGIGQSGDAWAIVLMSD